MSEKVIEFFHQRFQDEVKLESFNLKDIKLDLRVVAALASRLLVMRHGKIMEEGPAAELFAGPKSEYTRALFAAAFNLETAPEGAAAQ